MSQCICVALKDYQICFNGCIRKQDRVIRYTAHIGVITVDVDRRPLYVPVVMVVGTIAMSKAAMFVVSVCADM